MRIVLLLELGSNLYQFLHAPKTNSVQTSKREQALLWFALQTWQAHQENNLWLSFTLTENYPQSLPRLMAVPMLFFFLLVLVGFWQNQHKDRLCKITDLNWSFLISSIVSQLHNYSERLENDLKKSFEWKRFVFFFFGHLHSPDRRPKHVIAAFQSATIPHL